MDWLRFLFVYRWSVLWVLDKLFYFFDSWFLFFKYWMEYWSFILINKKEYEILIVYERIMRIGSDVGWVKRKLFVCYCLNNFDYVIGYVFLKELW